MDRSLSCTPIPPPPPPLLDITPFNILYTQADSRTVPKLVQCLQGPRAYLTPPLQPAWLQCMHHTTRVSIGFHGSLDNLRNKSSTYHGLWPCMLRDEWALVLLLVFSIRMLIKETWQGNLWPWFFSRVIKTFPIAVLMDALTFPNIFMC